MARAYIHTRICIPVFGSYAQAASSRVPGACRPLISASIQVLDAQSIMSISLQYRHFKDSFSESPQVCPPKTKNLYDGTESSASAKWLQSFLGITDSGMPTTPDALVFDTPENAVVGGLVDTPEAFVRGRDDGRALVRSGDAAPSESASSSAFSTGCVVSAGICACLTGQNREYLGHVAINVGSLAH